MQEDVGRDRVVTSWRLGGFELALCSPANPVQILNFTLTNTLCLTDSSILAVERSPQYEHCQCVLTVHHILVRCPHHLQPVRGDVFGNKGIMELFQFHL